MAKRYLKDKAISLRNEGFSYSDIQIKIGVSKSTLSDWLKGMPYRPNKFVLDKLKRAQEESSRARTRIRLESERKSLLSAKDDIGTSISKRDLLFLGIGLYLGEGSKTGMVRVVNSDPEIIKLTMIWLRKTYGLLNKNFSIRIHLYPDSDIQRSIGFWSKNTGLPVSQFHKTSIDYRMNKRLENKGKLPFGTAHLTVKSCGEKKFGVFLQRRILSSIEVIKNKAGMV